MAYLFALIGIVAIGFLLWRAFGPSLNSDDGPSAPRTGGRAAPRGPDDDPEFLHDLDRRTRGPNGSGTNGPDTDDLK